MVRVRVVGAQSKTGTAADEGSTRHSIGGNKSRCWGCAGLVAGKSRTGRESHLKAHLWVMDASTRMQVHIAMLPYPTTPGAIPLLLLSFQVAT